ACIIDLKRGVITFANAGHNFPVIAPVSPTDPRLGKPLKTAKPGMIPPISLKQMGTPLGLEPDIKFKEKTMTLAAGDR
ncbi:hypothetical protein, partial [Klebsiella pneumoniae]|uniref:hypothetical protein n=1 Tax=Klebsiella pneumoniae TaxID=573 RepID=UPI003B987AE2